MNNALRNWKTSSLGVIGLIVSLSAIWAPEEYHAKIQATGAAIVASGLLLAKDNDKTGVS